MNKNAIILLVGVLIVILNETILHIRGINFVGGMFMGVGFHRLISRQNPD